MNAEQRSPYPPIRPYASGRLDVGDGHELYWELCGNPDGKPVVFLHGGPGSGCTPAHRRLFDPARYRILLFDQRGCGRSTPLGSLNANTTQHLVADIERLRIETGTERWVLFGGSWGAALALAYAEAHPERAEALILRGVFTGRSSELAWYYREGASLLFPEEWEQFLQPLAPADRSNPIPAYRHLLTHPDRQIRAGAALAWTRWEARTMSVRPNTNGGTGGFTASDSVIAFARIENHYFFHDLWLQDGQLLRDANRLAGIPGVIVQGRYDVVTPPVTAYALTKVWPDAELQMVEDAGHAFSEPGTLHRLLLATDRFAA